jgi:clan AA aspartic protease
MITGSIQGRQATITLPVFGEDGAEIEVEFVLDTGFTGVTTLPPALCLSLEALFLRVQRAGLADGSPILLRVYAVTLLWDGQERTVEALAMEGEPLIGMTLLDDHDVFLRVREGSVFTIKSIEEED